MFLCPLYVLIFWNVLPMLSLCPRHALMPYVPSIILCSVIFILCYVSLCLMHSLFHASHLHLRYDGYKPPLPSHQRQPLLFCWVGKWLLASFNMPPGWIIREALPFRNTSIRGQTRHPLGPILSLWDPLSLSLWRKCLGKWLVDEVL